MIFLNLLIKLILVNCGIIEGSILKFIILMLNFVGRKATLLIFAAMLVFLILSHTVGTIESLTKMTIRAVASSVSSGHSGRLTMETVDSRDQAKVIEDLEERNGRLTKKNRLAAVKQTSLESENNKLRDEQRVFFRGKEMSAKTASSQVAGGLQRRTKRVAATNLASVAGESIPFYGIAIIVGATSYELKSACDTMKDLYDLEVALDPDEASEEGRDYVCGLQVPTKDEIWQSTKNSPHAAWQTAVAAYDGSSDWVSTLEVPDFSGGWSSTKEWVAGWFD